MKRIFYFLLPLMSLLPCRVGAWEVNFTSGLGDFTLVNLDGMAVETSDVLNISAKTTWFQAMGGRLNGGKVAMSCSHREADEPTDNWMITPQLTISSEDTWLTWDANSVHYDLRESYEVLLSTEGAETDDFETVLFSIDEETYFPTHRMISLADYAGCDVYIAFRHTSTSKYLLAVDNVFVGELSGTSLEATDQTLHSSGNTGTHAVTGSLRNVGEALGLASIECTLDDGNVLSQTFEALTLQPDEEQVWNFDVPVSLNEATYYEVAAVDTNGERHWLLGDSIFCTNYPRTYLMEKVTGYWCNSCYTANLFLNEQKERFGDQMIEVAVQYPSNAGNDVGDLVYDEFYDQITVYSLPSIIYDRNLASPQSGAKDTTKLWNAVIQPCDGLVSIESAEYDGTNISGTVRCEFAYDLDNSDDLYRWGFALLENKVATTATQANNSTLYTDNEYYYLPSTILQPLYAFKHVVRGTASAFEGLSGSVPATIEAGESYTYDYELEVPDRVSDTSAGNLIIVAYVLDTATGVPVNSAAFTATENYPEGISPAPSLTQKDEDAAWYTLDGRRIARPTTSGLYIRSGEKVLIK